MKLILIGPPGAGKGTQSEQLCKKFNIIQLSTGDLLRKHESEGTELGKLAGSYIKDGKLVPDKVIMDMIKTELAKPEVAKGFILDGVPRTVPQAEELDEVLEEINQMLDHVIVIDLENEEIVQRLSGRRICKTCHRVFHMLYNPPPAIQPCELGDCNVYQRSDDNEKTVRHRLAVYEEKTMPLIEFYSKKGLVFHVDGSKKMDEVFKDIVDILDK